VRGAPARAALAPGLARGSSRLADYVALAKPRLNLLVVVTSAAGSYLGAPEVSWSVMAPAVAGTALVAAGAATLNQVAERETDALMRRTRTRPLPDHRVSPQEALIYGLALSAIGLVTLAIGTNLLATGLALTTLVVYLLIYTPMKRRSEAATLVGAIPGALPPLIGWAASSGTLSLGGLALFAIVFFWQIPHFMAIAWLYRDDYANAGFPMLPVIDRDGRRTGRAATRYAAALVPASVVPAAVGVSGMWYLAIALALGVLLLGCAWQFAVRRDSPAARRLFLASIIYLPVLWAAMILNA
jgi:protoheme IX farnesyltransferase